MQDNWQPKPDTTTDLDRLIQNYVYIYIYIYIYIFIYIYDICWRPIQGDKHQWPWRNIRGCKQARDQDNTSDPNKQSYQMMVKKWWATATTRNLDHGTWEKWWQRNKQINKTLNQIISRKLRNHHPHGTYLESSERIENANPEPSASEGKWRQMMGNKWRDWETNRKQTMIRRKTGMGSKSKKIYAEKAQSRRAKTSPGRIEDNRMLSGEKHGKTIK